MTNVLITLTAVTPMDTTGILDLINEKNAQAQVTIRGISVTLAIVFVVWAGIKTRGALAAIIVAGLVAGLFVWIVFSVTSLKNRVDNEVGAGNVATAVHPPAQRPV